jgi:hypothetical protein
MKARWSLPARFDALAQPAMLVTIQLGMLLHKFVQLSKIIWARVTHPGPSRPPWIAAAGSRCRNSA